MSKLPSFTMRNTTYLIFVTSKSTNVALYPLKSGKRILITQIERALRLSLIPNRISQRSKPIVEVHVNDWGSLASELDEVFRMIS